MSFARHCFKAYDIRGRYPADLNPDLAFCLGQAFVHCLGSVNVVVGRDARLSGEALENALTAGLVKAGARVTSIGMGGTEEIYYTAATQGFDGGIMITGSHNPADENGFKMVRGGAIPISGDSGLRDIRDEAQRLYTASERFVEAGGVVQQVASTSFRQQYIQFLLDYTGAAQVARPLRIHVDAGNGCAGLVLKVLCPQLPHQFTFSNLEPDGRFPNGVPNPLLPERREATAQAVRDNHADMGIAWDGDFDRCFFYDAEGNFIEGYYVVGLLAAALLARFPGGKIIHDPRLTWNTQDVVTQAGGVPVMSKTGHAFIKERMRAEDAVYGGEMSAHHYFRDFAYCDSGMLPWLLVAGLVAEHGKTLAELVEDRMRTYPCSGEINSRVPDAQVAIARVRAHFAGQALTEDHTDGLSMEFADWRFNLRSSNTEPILRLNVESRGDAALLEQRVAKILTLIRQ